VAVTDLTQAALCGIPNASKVQQVTCWDHWTERSSLSLATCWIEQYLQAHSLPRLSQGHDPSTMQNIPWQGSHSP